MELLFHPLSYRGLRTTSNQHLPLTPYIGDAVRFALGLLVKYTGTHPATSTISTIEHTVGALL